MLGSEFIRLLGGVVPQGPAVQIWDNTKGTAAHNNTICTKNKNTRAVITKKRGEGVGGGRRRSQWKDAHEAFYRFIFFSGEWVVTRKMKGRVWRMPGETEWNAREERKGLEGKRN